MGFRNTFSSERAGVGALFNANEVHSCAQVTMEPWQDRHLKLRECNACGSYSRQARDQCKQETNPIWYNTEMYSGLQSPIRLKWWFLHSKFK